MPVGLQRGAQQPKRQISSGIYSLGQFLSVVVDSRDALPAHYQGNLVLVERY